MDRIATLHVVRERQGRQLVVMGRMLTDRWRLRRVEGLVFAKVLGTGRGDDTGPSADLLRQAYFMVWHDAAAAQHFLDTDPIARRWASLTVERELGLRLVSGRGTWAGRSVLDDMRPVVPDAENAGGFAGGVTREIIVLTRARIRPGSWRAFRRASRRAATAFGHAPGLHWTLGIGELPVGLLGTVSCWRSAADLDAFLTTDTAHTTAVAHAPEWFAESLFARFAPWNLRSTG